MQNQAKEKVLWILKAIQELWALRTDDARKNFYWLVECILLNKDLFETFSLLSTENENLLKSYKFIWQELLNNKVYTLKDFEDAKLTEKKYSWYFITISDEEYINWSYSLLASDFVSNFEALWSWIFDYMNNEYLIPKEQMVSMLKWLDIIKWFNYKKEVWSTRFSLNPAFSASDLNMVSLSILYKKYASTWKQQEFIDMYKKLFENRKIYDKVSVIYKDIIKLLTIQFLEKNNIKTQWYEFDNYSEKQYELILELYDKLKNQEKFIFEWKNNKNEWQNVKFQFNLKWSNLQFSWSYTESLKKEVIFQDLRKRETKNWIILTLWKIKNEFDKLKLYENKMYKKSNTFITQIKKSNFQNQKEFNTFITSDKYKWIVNQKEKLTLK